MSPHLALLNVQLNHIVMVPQSLCGLRISGLGGSLVAGDLLWRETKTLMRSVDSGVRLQPVSGMHPSSIAAQIGSGFTI